jgi:hypothetical protein
MPVQINLQFPVDNIRTVLKTDIPGELHDGHLGRSEGRQEVISSINLCRFGAVLRGY